MSPGELWAQQYEIGLEVTPGTAVASTRLMYFKPDSKLTREREVRRHRFATGTRDNVRASTLGPTKVGGTVIAPLSASEIVELLLMTLAGGVTPVGAGTPQLWTWVPGTALDAATLRWHDGARPWVASGVYGSKLTIAGSVGGENNATVELFGQSMVQGALTGGLTERIPDFIEGWETRLYIDAFGGTAGSTVVAGTLLNWDVMFDGQLARKYFADNTLAAGAIVLGEIEVEAKLTFEASKAVALTEFNNWEANTKRLVRLEFGQNEVIDGADKKFVTVDVPGAWSAVDLGGSDEGTRTYELSLGYVFDTVNDFGLQVRCQNARTAAW